MSALASGETTTHMTLSIKPSRFLSTLLLGSVLILGMSACSDDHGDHDHADASNPDAAHLMFVTAPGTTLTAGQDEAVSWMVHTEGTLHHTEIRACMGHRDDCGNDGMDTYDENFMGTKNGDNYEGMVNIPTAGPWTIVVFAHVGGTPHTSEAIHAMVQ